MTITSDKTLFQSVINMVDSLSAAGHYDTIIHILSLLCLFSVLNQAPVSIAPASTAAATIPPAGNPLQKLLGDLIKPDGASTSTAAANPLGSMLGSALSSPDLLMSLLPLLNNPQIKAKINPTNIASIMGMINNLGGLGGLGGLAASLGGLGGNAPPAATDKPAALKTKPEPTEKKTLDPKAGAITPIEPKIPEPPPPQLAIVSEDTPVPDEPEKKAANRFLRWKTNF